MTIVIGEAFQHVERTLIGCRPNTSSVKPVHIANGLFRNILGYTTDTGMLNRFVFVAKKKDGAIPSGHELASIYGELLDNNRLMPEDIQESDIAELRSFLRKVVDADGGVYLHSQDMESYSAGFSGFISRDRVAQDGGELVAELLRLNNSQLYTSIERTIESPRDVITALSLPTLSINQREWVPSFDASTAQFLNKPLPGVPASLLAGLLKAADCLAEHVNLHPNKLVGLRTIVLYACFVVIRHLALLESYYVPNAERRILPFLLDFSPSERHPVARASVMTYTLVCQSISRFYAWALGEYLRTNRLFSIEALRQEPIPAYTQTSASSRERNEAERREIWELAKGESHNSEDPYSVFGQALHDIMALEASGNPIAYLRQLGLRSGLLRPPDNFHPSKRFAVQQDMLEVLVRGAVKPGECIDLPSLQARFLERYGVIIGGRREDEANLVGIGAYQADSNALADNLKAFATRLSRLGFAKLLADGVLRVELEG
ncbi:MAG: hypothetical protein KMY50_03115 [Candidatus Desulforudis sp.]|nr:hypothetical protein [Desulforudis sp.]